MYIVSISNSRPSLEAHLSLFVSRLFPSCRRCRWRQCPFNERSHCRTWHSRSSSQPRHHCRGKKLVSWAAWGGKRSAGRSTRARGSGQIRFCTWSVRRSKWVSSVSHTWPSKLVDVDNSAASVLTASFNKARENTERHLAECYGLFRTVVLRLGLVTQKHNAPRETRLLYNRFSRGPTNQRSLGPVSQFREGIEWSYSHTCIPLRQDDDENRNIRRLKARGNINAAAAALRYACGDNFAHVTSNMNHPASSPNSWLRFPTWRSWTVRDQKNA